MPDPAEPPRILITRAEDVLGEDWDDYARCIQRAGGEPIPFDTPSFEGIDALPPHYGVLITAGVDIDPARYGQPRSDRVAEVDPHRDEVEIALVQHALQTNTPLFCICRGFQVFNVARGGGLLQHLEEREPHRARRGADGVSIDSGWHELVIRNRSLIARITGAELIRTNSRHHQAVTADTLAPDTSAAAIAPDGVIEAIEVPGHPFALGVQWHPERPEMTDDPSMHNASTALFEAFVTACRNM